jgi:hypothetical protein
MKVYVLIVEGDAIGVYLTREHAIKVALKHFEGEDFMISHCDLWNDQSWIEKKLCES